MQERDCVGEIDGGGCRALSIALKYFKEKHVHQEVALRSHCIYSKALAAKRLKRCKSPPRERDAEVKKKLEALLALGVSAIDRAVASTG